MPGDNLDRMGKKYYSKIKEIIQKAGQTPFLDFYHKCMDDDSRMPNEGMCCNFENTKETLLIDLFDPTHEESRMANHGYIFWGDDYSLNLDNYSFNPFRQTVILFCAAMNNEL